MGQQQLLLLVLATVIVGLATVAGIQAFEQGSTRANQDALNQNAVKIASDIQANLMEPEQFGGAGLKDMSNHSTGDTPLISSLGYDTESAPSYFSSSLAQGDTWVTSDGACGITENTATGPIKVTCESRDNLVRTRIDSLSSEGITQDTSYVK